ncbi:MAG: sensor histidine kinase [Betaproteobacteria bacterium]|nr:MAG: sensor histidine kinase [Betaproteobacteria bacterium]TMH33039.1 MAG: sensor histidine kinase [Betaproteobacteria bacterium]
MLRRTAPLIGTLVLAAVVALSAGLAFAWSEQRAFAQLGDTAVHQLNLYAAVLDIELGKQGDLPGLIDADGEIGALLKAPEAAGMRSAINRRLTRFVARSGALWAGVLDAQGRVLASSDWFRPDSQLGRRMTDEPCVADALAGNETRHFAPDAAGASTVCLARPLRRDASTLGAVIVRTSLEPIETAWVESAFRPESEKPIVVDDAGIVIMSSVPAWKRKPLSALTLPVRALPDGAELVSLQASASGTRELRVMHERPLARVGWRLLMLSSTTHVWRDARAAAWSGGAAAGCVGLVIALLLQRRRVVAQKLAAREALQRANDELEQKVRQRTAELEMSNRELRREVHEREHAEQVLRQAQEELVQAGKLALLGQLSAGISHELGQPLTALRALADNGRLLLERAQLQLASENFQAINGLAERMGRITAQLKSFTRKAPVSERALPLAQAVANARLLLRARLQAECVTLREELPDSLAVQCDAHRLEQVLVNLMANAIDAMHASEQRVLTICAAASGTRVVVRVADSGPGIPAQLGARLFEPFFTTKPPGEGLGLGLVISSHIVREFGGVLRSVPAESGAVFEFDVAQASVEGQQWLTQSASH